MSNRTAQPCAFDRTGQEQEHAILAVNLVILQYVTDVSSSNTVLICLSANARLQMLRQVHQRLASAAELAVQLVEVLAVSEVACEVGSLVPTAPQCATSVADQTTSLAIAKPRQ